MQLLVSLLLFHNIVSIREFQDSIKLNLVHSSAVMVHHPEYGTGKVLERDKSDFFFFLVVLASFVKIFQ